MAKVFNVDQSFDYALLSGASCAFGVFDGVHAGHQYLINEAKRTAAENGGAALVLTFDIDPDEVFAPGKLKKLMTNAQRIQALADQGVDGVVVFPFTREFAAQSPEEFLQTTFNGAVPFAMHTGFDFRFGCKAAGTVEDLRAWAKAGGTRICAHDLKSNDGLPVTATRIRGLLAQGKCESARDLLNHPYTFEGVVQVGRGEGTDMGFATANLELPAMMQVLAEAVYAAYVYVDGQRFKAAMSVGVAPTFEEAHATCEVHILDFSGELYGKSITVEPVHYLRPMIKFDSVEELIATVQGNISWVRQNL